MIISASIKIFKIIVGSDRPPTHIRAHDADDGDEDVCRFDSADLDVIVG